MPLPGVAKIRVDDVDLQRVQDRLHAGVEVLRTIPLLDGVLLKAQVIATTATNIGHGLGRAPLGWIVVSKTGLGDIYENQANRTDRFLSLQSSVAVTADLWVF